MRETEHSPDGAADSRGCLVATSTVLELPTDGELADGDVVPMHRVPRVGPEWSFRWSSMGGAPELPGMRPGRLGQRASWGGSQR
jgi:hypothetical protein